MPTAVTAIEREHLEAFIAADWRDIAIIGLFLDTGRRLEGMTELRHDASDSDLSDVDLRGNVVRIITKGRRGMVLPIGRNVAAILATTCADS